eukprot:TRINITY_DN32327_c0_g1_i1.p1 TRINITY_DN32327_c0_g1~~TRINITY_DN32327_c0_g1_i1.p1  ORF type:complete len:169 (+),score=24.65 TRINITY_DN32327_c0_g1_i1:180-686(+)
MIFKSSSRASESSPTLKSSSFSSSSGLDAFFNGSEGPLVYSGGDVCIPRSADLLESIGLPGGLLPLQDVQQCGFDKETGSVWIKQKKKTQHYVKSTGKLISFDEEIRAQVGEGRLKNVRGVKAKEHLLWAPVGDISVEGSPGRDQTIRFKTYGGISRSFPADAFHRKD